MNRRTVLNSPEEMAVAEVSAGGEPQPCSTPLPPGQRLGIASVPNLRDLGGYPAAGGKVVRRGLVYRCDQLNPITPADLSEIGRLGIRSDFDLRTAGEVAACPDVLPPGVTRVWLDVLADADQPGSDFFGNLLRNPQQANAALGGGKVEAVFDRVYRHFIELPSATQAYRQLFASLAEPDQLPALFHCTTGKDRTGWAAAALLTLLGVPKESVMEDFLRSNEYILPHYQGMIDAFAAAGGEKAILLAIFGVEPEYLNSAFDAMEQHYGTIEQYFSEGLGIDAAAQQRLRELYLQPAA